MKNLSLVFTVVFCFIISCGNHATKNKQEKESPALKENMAAESKQDTTKWIDSFRAFRDAVYQRNKEKVKQYIDFPIDGSNELWYLVLNGHEKQLASVNDSIFTEKDFDKYFDALFPKRFISCLLKLKSEELWKTGEIQSPENPFLPAFLFSHKESSILTRKDHNVISLIENSRNKPETQ